MAKKERMSKKSLANLRPIKKGQVLNPLGAGAHNPEKKKLARLTTEELVEVGTVVVCGSEEDLKAIRRDGTKSVLQHWIAAIAQKAIKDSSVSILDQLMNRLIGPVEQRFNHKGIPPSAGINPTVIVLPAKKNVDGS